jgi:diguanylate cyclase (GGDEF)-like protein
MISLRKHIENYRDNLDEPALAAFRNVLLAIGKCGERAVPGLGLGIDRKMDELQGGLVPPVTSGLLTCMSQQVESELSGWAGRVLEHHNDIERELTEIIGVVARAAESVSERDQKFALEMGDHVGRLGSIAEVNDLALVRRSVVESTRALKACVEKMAEESKTALLELTVQVKDYRGRLEEAERISATDLLTEVASRREFERHLAARVIQGNPFCLIMVDLNDFKAVNDRFGHLAGDDLLKQFAVELRAQFATPDMVGRWGGDEFVAIAAGLLKDGEEKAERIRKWALGEYKVNEGARLVKIRVGASIGVVQWDGAETGLELLSRADQRVYLGKNSGAGKKTG